MLSLLKEDLGVFNEKHADQGIFRYFYYPDVRVIVLFRLSQWCYQHSLKPIAYLLTNLNDLLHGVWIGSRVVAGKGFSLGHPRGVLINPETIIGEYCTIINQVTLSAPSVVIEDFVEIGAGAKVISMPNRPVTVGAHSIVGAGAVVTQSVPSFSILAGVPAKVIKTKNLADWLLGHP